MPDSPVGLDVPALEAYLRRTVPGFTGPVEAELLSGGRSNLTYLLRADGVRWVLRRPPLGGLTPSAHDMGREYRVVDALQNTAVPVARTVALCEDPAVLGTPFSIVSHVDGPVLRTAADLNPLSDAELADIAETLMTTMTRLHAVSYAEVGLSGLGRPAGYLRRQVDRWADQWRRVATRELDDLQTLHARLSAAVPAESGAAIVHGDFRIDNAILGTGRPAEVRAVVDWEMATLGDPLADLALSLVYRDPAFAPVLPGGAASTDDRLPSWDTQAQYYASESGRDLSDLDFHLALGYFKIAVIAEGIHARHLAGQTVGDGFDTVGQAVPELVAAGLRAFPAA
ncbi:phosphotransferase family protein [Amycolatopsis nivea]